MESTTLAQAAAEYRALRDRITNPAGSFDKGGRWYPDEPCSCKVRYPSKRFPYSYLLHCRTAAHIAETRHVERAALLREAKRQDAEHAPYAA